MAKQIKEIEVEYPDCDICGKDIGENEYLEIALDIRKRTPNFSGFVGEKTLSICERCRSYPEIWKQKLFEVVDEVVNRKHR